MLSVQVALIGSRSSASDGHESGSSGPKADVVFVSLELKKAVQAWLGTRLPTVRASYSTLHTRRN